MTRVPTLCILSLLPMAAAFGSATVVDRLALVVGKTAFTQSEVEDEVRFSELENGKPLDLSPARRKEAAERLVDQQLLRDEIDITGFQLTAVQADALFNKFCQEHFDSGQACEAALARYGVTESLFKQHLVWEITLVRFTDQRFAPLADTEGGTSDGDSVERGMDAWLKERRAATRIVYKQEAFQ